MRSLLFVPADSERKLTKSDQSGADVLIYDLEDSVSLERKPAARELLARFLGARPTNSESKHFVRVNALDTGLTLLDLVAVMPMAPDGIVLPKCADVADVDRLTHYLESFEALHGIKRSTQIIAIVTETAQSLAGLDSYRFCDERLIGLMWGAEDLSGDIGALTNKQTDGQTWSATFEYARTRCLLAAAAAGLIAIDAVATDIPNLQGLRTETATAYRDGFSAKAAIHPNQVSIINECMTPDAQTQEWAQKVIAAFEASPTVGVATLDGKMLDMPHLRLAKKVQAAATAARRA
jgi:citrate lyase subunit beta / citryl-CoA lyase